MTEHYKLAVVKSLSELLPPFAESVISLLNYVKEDGDYDIELLEKLVEINSHSRKVSDSLTNELDRMREILSSDQEVGDSDSISEIKKEMDLVRHLFGEALFRIGDGVAILIYLMAEEKGLLKVLEKKPTFDDLFSGIKSTDLNTAINNLYQGAKELTEIIDKVIDD